MAPLLTATVLAAVLIVATAAPMDKNDDAVTLSNTAPRLDADGKIVNAHDGSVIQDPVSGRFYLYGFLSFDCTADSPPHGYDNCVSCALVGNVYPVAYSSPDLVRWKLETDAPNQTLAHNQMNLTAFGDQARVLYNARTKKYVAINRGPIGSAQGARVAFSDSPIGIYTYGSLRMRMLSHAVSSLIKYTRDADPYVNPSSGPFAPGGAGGVGFLDTGGLAVGSQLMWHDGPKGKAYVAFNTKGKAGTLYPSRQCMLELSDDWLSATGRKSCWYEILHTVDLAVFFLK